MDIEGAFTDYAAARTTNEVTEAFDLISQHFASDTAAAHEAIWERDMPCFASKLFEATGIYDKDRRLTYHDCGASLIVDGDVVHTYGWPRDGGHVWRVECSGRQQITYEGSTKATMMTEGTPRDTAMHIARVHGLTYAQVIPE